MPRTVRIRHTPDDVYLSLQRHAAAAGVSVPELLRREAARLASRPTVEEWLERTSRRSARVRSTDVTRALDDIRGPWPDAGR